MSLGGAGGKGTWGKPGSELLGVGEENVKDPHDPNYDSDSEVCLMASVVLMVASK